MSWKTYYKEHLLSMEQLIEKLPKENVTFLNAHAAAVSTAINTAMAEAKDRFHNCRFTTVMSPLPTPFMEPDMEGHFSYSTIFVAPGSRKGMNEGRGDYVPLYYHEYPKYVRNELKPDVVVLHLSEPDEHGYCTFGVTVDFQRVAAETAKLVVAQINPNMPSVMGKASIHITQVDWFVEVNDEIPTIPRAQIGDVEKAIGANCAGLIHDGDCLQLGIGSIPEAVVMQLGDKRNLGIHSEMFSDGAAELMDSGIITNSCKNIDKGLSTTTFAMGTKELYKFVNKHKGMNFNEVDYTNHPRVISQLKNMVGINSALQVDILGQVAADTVGKFQHSGPGGQVDFVRGINMSENGINIIALPSTAKGGSVSRITLELPRYGGVTTNRFDVDYIITEYGVAKLWGKSNTERAEALISIAHPNFRESLKKEYLEWLG